MKRHLVFAALAAVALAACSHAPVYTAPSMGAMPFPVDSARAQMVADGVTRRVIRSSKGPWTINVLYVDLDRCNTVEAVKGADSVNGRFKVTETLARLGQHERVLGGVNADFFDLKTGAPTNLLVINGRLMHAPNKQPVFALDSSGVPHFAHFTLTNGKLSPFFPLQAVGGRPWLVHDSTFADSLDKKGSFWERNPRTAMGIARNGKRLIFAAIDGREYQNAGMTIRETAELMLALGAREAINLDGGGSTTMVFADPDSSGKLRIANHPSDKEGERTVGDALAIVHRCR